jgi:hypothetical protein
LAPPAATSVIRDLTVRTGAKQYNGPAGKLVQNLFWLPKHGNANAAVIARNYQTQQGNATATAGKMLISKSHNQVSNSNHKTKTSYQHTATRFMAGQRRPHF